MHRSSWRTIAAALALVLVSLGGARAGDLTVFAAASLKNALDDVDAQWRAEHRTPVAAAYASSSTLARQIAEGAPADVFISADEQWMAYLVRRNLVETPRPLLGNRLVLIAPRDSKVKAEIGPGFDLAGLLGDGRLAVGDPSHVPAGIYAKQALEKLGAWGAVESKLAPAADVRAALTLVSQGEAPLGIVYATDARIDPGVRVVAAFPDSSHAPIVYPVAVVARSRNATARNFAAYLFGPAAGAIFERYGFRLVKPSP